MHTIELPVNRNGLLVEVKVGLSAPRRALMWQRGLVQPPAVAATFIIDTGADTTMVDEQTMRSLNLTPTGQTRVMTSSSGGLPEPCDVYDVCLEILGKGDSTWKIDPLQVLARPLLNQSTQGMIGRDVLDRTVLIYDGPRGLFKLVHAR